jgi:NCAIR mutase (PurE)-related protein
VLQYYADARLAVYENNDNSSSSSNSSKPSQSLGTVAVMCAGTSDLAVAEEAAVLLELSGAKVERIYDVGVAGIHRLFAALPRVHTAQCAIAVAGMDGALLNPCDYSVYIVRTSHKVYTYQDVKCDQLLPHYILGITYTVVHLSAAFCFNLTRTFFDQMHCNCCACTGAMPSVVAGLVRCPVVAVPTSVGYGAAFGNQMILLYMYLYIHTLI